MIRADKLTYCYRGALSPALKGISFTVERGEVFGFLGPSGAGKSTTQKILIGLLREYRGRVAVMGREAKEWGPEYYERIGVAFEVPNLYLKLTALENLAYFRSLYTGPTEEPTTLLERLGLGDDGDVRVGEFSRGMRVRLNVARALLHRPELLFLDEPTAGLDPVNARRVKEVIRQQRAEGVTIFLTTHDMTAAADLCDRVAFLVDGEIRLIDAPRALTLRYGRRLVRVEYSSDGHAACREYPLDGLAENDDFLRLLRTGSVQTIHTQETTLENIFVEVTGRALA